MKHVVACFALALVLVAGVCFAATPVPEVPVKGMVTVVDLGAKTCIPCKMMVPVLDAMEKQYQGKASVVFIDVRENPAQATKFGIRTIPTQIFYDKNGKEMYRHEGFLDQQPFAERVEKLLAE
uniref:Thioredoxin domain-containing protein n=1 Tax=Desulfovibrio sp. U5L TaxID=596152 RepID=I2Q6X8_9BACT